jgi:glucose/arabinose dehydrogenase
MPHATTPDRSVCRALLAAPVLLALMGQASGPEPHERSAQHDFRVVTVADGLIVPWGLTFLPGGDMLVTERPGRLRIVRNGRLLPAPVPGVPAVRAGGQGGLLDVVAHPRFAENRLIYLSYSKPNANGTQSTTAVVRGRFEGDRLDRVETVIEARAWSEGEGHYGSRLAFDREGHLFVTVGDRQVYPKDLEGHPAQDLSTHHGKVLRLHDDGRVPTDNPFIGRQGALPEIWSYGHRNPQGLVIDAETNEVWATEHGPQGGDELNLIERGKNYGWPVVGFGVMYRTGAAIHAGTMREGMEPPVHVWIPSIASSGLMRYRGNAFPRWRDSLFAGGLGGEQLVRLTHDGRRVTNVEQLVQRRGRIRDVRQGPDGLVYVAFEKRDGTATSIVRLEPVPGR